MQLKLFTLLLATMLVLPQVRAQTDVDTEITIAVPPPVCTIGGVTSLIFGTYYRPGSGSDQVTARPVENDWDGTTAGFGGGSRNMGLAVITATNITTWTLAVTDRPTVLTATVGGTTSELAYQFTWAQSDGGSWAAISGLSYTETGLGGEGSSDTHDFRFGGTVSGIASTTPALTFSATIELTASCS